MALSVRIAVLSIYAALLVACAAEESPRTPERAGQAPNSAEIAARLAAANVGAVTGNRELHDAQMGALNDDLRRSIRLADPARPIERESARSAARSVDGVRSVVWLDQHNLFAIVEHNAQRSYATIDAVCLELEPLGDTLGVVVNLQSGAARTGDELEILSRNCQLAPGERAMFQPNRQIDVIDPDIRRAHRANQTR